ncbi:hypothetical protein V8C40DRAFT_30640 [Trichoderma camerunense]
MDGLSPKRMNGRVMHVLVWIPSLPGSIHPSTLPYRARMEKLWTFGIFFFVISDKRCGTWSKAAFGDQMNAMRRCFLFLISW